MTVVFLPVFFCGMFLAQGSVIASNAQILRGVAKVITAPFQIPSAMLADSQKVVFPFGLVTGAISGTFQTLMKTVSGGLDMAQGAAPYAKYMLFF